MHEKRVWAAFIEKRERVFFSKFKTPQLTYDKWHGLRNKRNKLCYNLISLNVIIQKKNTITQSNFPPLFSWSLMPLLFSLHSSFSIIISKQIIHRSNICIWRRINHKQANNPRRNICIWRRTTTISETHMKKKGKQNYQGGALVVCHTRARNWSMWFQQAEGVHRRRSG